MERGLGGEDECSIRSPTYGTVQNETKIVPKSAWWSCTEWCLSKVFVITCLQYCSDPNQNKRAKQLTFNKSNMFSIFQSPGECDHVWASVRDVGTEITWNDCVEVDGKIDDEGVECNILEDEKELKCKLYPDEKGISMSQDFRSFISWLHHIKQKDIQYVRQI